MGKITTRLRLVATQVRGDTISTMKNTGTTGPELHIGAWMVRYTKGGHELTLGPTPCGFMDPSKQKLLYGIGARSTNKVKHVEDDFLIDLAAKFKLTGASPIFSAPTDCNARVNFWLYYSPCTACFQTLTVNLTNRYSYGSNTLNSCWLKMTFERYYHDWGSANAAQSAYDQLKNDTNGQIVIKPQNLVELED
jgi:hypothetical protein